MIYRMINHLISISFLLDMDTKPQPDPRFKEFEEQLDAEGKPLGFCIPDCAFVFKYDKQGGWFDEQGRYYNMEGVLQPDCEGDQDYQNEDEEDDISDNDDELVDEFEDLLRMQEEGITKKITKKEVQEVKQASPAPPPQQEKKKQEDGKDFKGLLQKYLLKEHLKQNLPGELFIYFKQRSKFFENVKPEVEHKQSVDDKNKLIEANLKVIQQKRHSFLKSDPWLGQPQVFLDFSGDSLQQNEYDRYWYGYIKTVPDKYLDFLEKIGKSQVFNLLQLKTFYSLKSKFYLKKSQQKIKSNIASLLQKINAIADNQVVIIKIDGLPQNFPLSFVYDLIQYAGGSYQDIEQARIIDEISVQLTVLKPTALKIANLQAYNHDKGQFIEIIITKQPKQRVSNPQKRFYYIQIEGPYKLHERQLRDTLALLSSRQQLARLLTKEEYAKSKIRFLVGSPAALKKVLMFRGESLNVVHIFPKQPEPSK